MLYQLHKSIFFGWSILGDSYYFVYTEVHILTAFTLNKYLLY